MPKHGIISGSTDQFADFVAAVVANLPRDLDPVLMKNWIDNEAGLRKTLYLVLSSSHAGIEFRTIPTVVHFGPTIENAARLFEVEIRSPNISSLYFPSCSVLTRQARIILLRFPKKIGLGELLEETAKRRLGLARWEELLAVGVSCRGQMPGSSIIAGGSLYNNGNPTYPSALCLRTVSGRCQFLDLEASSSWEPHYLFAAIQRD